MNSDSVLSIVTTTINQNVAVSTNIPVITLNKSIKIHQSEDRDRQSRVLKMTPLLSAYFLKTHFKFNNIDGLKIKEWKKGALCKY